eukprot:TRINITY_DN75_c0_g1_i1.p1 TRINITY_DN75_c0_g1~~TRINITY_DN75_c0_g1_i1.p1  ORF type:complete len:455 (-),score=106.00 TRINITY_DN75_c0_g1_i1:168-1532(-)
MVRSLLALAAAAPSALALNSRLVALESETVDQRIELAVQMRQYAMHMSHAERTEEAKPATLLAHGYASSLGESASLTETGYSSVAALRNQEAMQSYAEKLLEQDGLQVKDKGMLQRVMPFYSGECATQSLVALRRELHEATKPHGCHAAWVGTKANSTKKPLSLLAKKPAFAVHPLHGDVAPLNEAGYQAVVALKSNEEMKKFIRRASKENGLQILHSGGLAGFARYYSGVCASQSYAALVKELKSVQHLLRTTSVSYNAPADEAVDEQEIKGRIAANTGLKQSQIHVKTGTSRLPNTTQVQQLVASNAGVEQDRVTVMQTGGKVAHHEEPKKHEVEHVSHASSPKAVLASGHKHEKPEHKHKASKAPTLKHGAGHVSAHKPETAKAAEAPHPRTVRSYVVTVTSGMHDAPVEDLLKGLTSKMDLKVNGVPATMVASVAQAKRCGGGWVAPKVQ